MLLELLEAPSNNISVVHSGISVLKVFVRVSCGHFLSVDMLE